MIRDRDVFVNCPFSEDYQEHFRAIIFTVIRSGFNVRCAREVDDGGENRFDKICKIIGECKLAVHDISKTELDKQSKLPRFNMPLELGLFLAAKKFGDTAQKRKRCIIFDREDFRYQKFISDIAGQDIHSHRGEIGTLISETASWLRAENYAQKIPGGAVIAKEFARFSKNLPKICKSKDLSTSELTFRDYQKIAIEWVLALQSETGR